MEFLDVVNKNDEVVGSATKQEVHDKFLMHRIVHVLVFNKKDKLALQLRSKNVPFCPYHWSTTVGGHVQSGESYEQAAAREFQEELGTNPKLEFFSKDFYEAPSGLKEFLTTFKTVSEGPFNSNPKEVELVKFFGMDEIQEMINSGEKFHPELLFLLRKHFGLKLRLRGWHKKF